MPKPKRFPSYREHAPSGRAVVTINRKDFYLGKYKSDESYRAYERLRAEWTFGGGKLPDVVQVTIKGLVTAYLRHAETRVTPADLAKISLALRTLCGLFGDTLAAEFGSRKLQLVRDRMIEQGRQPKKIPGRKPAPSTGAPLARVTVNERITCIRSLFKWGVARELVPPQIIVSLQAVEGLRQGRAPGAKESRAVRPVDDAHIEATIPHVSSVVAAMIQLQRLTGARPSEVCGMEWRYIERKETGLWLYRPPKHKNAWRGKVREVQIGRQGIAILKAYEGIAIDVPIFSPRATVDELNERRWQSSQIGRAKKRRKPQTARRVGAAYTQNTYRQAIRHGIAKANRVRLEAARAAGTPANQVQLVPDWKPHEIRHLVATELNSKHGIEVARVMLGHTSLRATEIYAEQDFERARQIARSEG